MIDRIDKTIEMSDLPTWLQELWELDHSLARRAEKHYLDLKTESQKSAIPCVSESLIEALNKKTHDYNHMIGVAGNNDIQNAIVEAKRDAIDEAIEIVKQYSR